MLLMEKLQKDEVFDWTADAEVGVDERGAGALESDTGMEGDAGEEHTDEDEASSDPIISVVAAGSLAADEIIW